MNKRASKSEENVKALGGIGCAGRNVADEAMKRGESPETPAAPHPVHRIAPRNRKRMGRPPLPQPAEQRTITFTTDLLHALEKFSAFSGKTQEFRRPGLSETVRVALRMWVKHDWSKDEKREAWLSAMGVNGDTVDG